MNHHIDQDLRVIFITGVSGAGLKTAVNAFEDFGVCCIDNLPIGMIKPSLELLKKENYLTKNIVAFGIHIQNESYLNDFLSLYKDLSQSYKVDQIFLTAEDSILQLRYSANRRRHPFLIDGRKLQEAFEAERNLLQPMIDLSDLVIDTSLLNPQQLAKVIEGSFKDGLNSRNLYVMISSFGFKYGPCHPVDSVFDVRFLKNPYFDPHLRSLTGISESVKDYIFKESDSQEFIQKLIDWHSWILPKYYDEGKHYFRIGIGCTGGQHRSVAIVEELHAHLNKASLGPFIINKSHRDLKIMSSTDQRI